MPADLRQAQASASRMEPILFFQTRSHKKRPDVSVAWVSCGKANYLAVLFPNGDPRIGYIPIVIIIGDLCGVAQHVFDDRRTDSFQRRTSVRIAFRTMQTISRYLGRFAECIFVAAGSMIALSARDADP